MELEKMGRDFQREMELQKKQIVERAQAEIAKILEGDEEEDDDDDDEVDGPNENVRVLCSIVGGHSPQFGHHSIAASPIK